MAAGMTGGLGYFYDEEGDFVDKVNAEIVTVQAVRTAAGEAQLRALLSDHVEKTGALLLLLVHMRVTPSASFRFVHAASIALAVLDKCWPPCSR